MAKYEKQIKIHKYFHGKRFDYITNEDDFEDEK